jgi:hypothetical protein
VPFDFGIENSFMATIDFSDVARLTSNNTIMSMSVA